MGGGLISRFPSFLISVVVLIVIFILFILLSFFFRDVLFILVYRVMQK